MYLTGGCGAQIVVPGRAQWLVCKHRAMHFRCPVMQYPSRQDANGAHVWLCVYVCL